MCSKKASHLLLSIQRPCGKLSRDYSLVEALTPQQVRWSRRLQLFTARHAVQAAVVTRRQRQVAGATLTRPDTHNVMRYTYNVHDQLEHVSVYKCVVLP